MKAMKFHGKIEAGKLKLSARNAMAGWISAQPDCPVLVEIRPVSRTRTNDQNAYYWGVVVDYIGKHLGYEPEEAHEALKWQFLRKPNSDPPTVISTARLSTAEFSEYVDRVVRWAASYLGVVIPDPE